MINFKVYVSVCYGRKLYNIPIAVQSVRMMLLCSIEQHINDMRCRDYFTKTHAQRDNWEQNIILASFVFVCTKKQNLLGTTTLISMILFSFEASVKTQAGYQFSSIFSIFSYTHSLSFPPLFFFTPVFSNYTKQHLPQSINDSIIVYI